MDMPALTEGTWEREGTIALLENGWLQLLLLLVVAPAAALRDDNSIAVVVCARVLWKSHQHLCCLVE